MAKHDIRNSVVFGPDKICWPEDYMRPACWAIPQSTMPKWSFGPHTDSAAGFYARARWLNSGTIIGTVGDMREVFKGAMAMVNHGYDQKSPVKGSDQRYFADLWGAQEWSRTKLYRNMSKSHEYNNERQPPPGPKAHMPKLPEGKKSEYHISVDHESQLFQTRAYYETWIAWLKYDEWSSSAGRTIFGKSVASGGEGTNQARFYLPEDIASSPAPFPKNFKPDWHSRSDKKTDRGRERDSWADLPLSTNVATRQVLPLLHVTGDKRLFDQWWQFMWYVPYGTELLKAAVRQASKRLPVHPQKIEGRKWWTAVGKEEDKRRGAKGGAWTDTGSWKKWEGMCGKHEKRLFD